VKLIFENCDYITIDGKYIGNILVDDLHTCFRRTAYNAIEKVETANTFALEIHKTANKDRYQFADIDLKQKIFDRIKKYADIACVKFELEVYLEEGNSRVEHYEYYVNWVDESECECENEAQTSYISYDGNMYIVIAKDKVIEDFFDMEEINDSERMDFRFSVCDVGDGYERMQDRGKN